jgi:cell division protease FtsH
MSEELEEERIIKAALNNSSPEDAMTPIQIIRSRRARLYQARDELKQEFIGLDDVIDKIIGQITVWYVMPEILTRPVIVCLWGMTGVGKTDFVRRLSRKLEMTNSFFEIQMSGKKSASMNPYGSSSIKDALNYSNLEPGKKGMLLLDEIQRFRTVDENGKGIRDVDSQDLWMLLSDGKFAGTTDKEDIFKIIFSDFYYYLPNEDDEDEDVDAPSISGDVPSVTKKSKKSKKFGYQTPYRDAKSLKKLLRLEDSIEDIMRWPRDKKMAVAMERMKDQALYEGDSYANLLVFVSGNLDEAYKMSDSVGDMDTDADILHQFSKRINLLTIKECLKKRFKPEQIARFGNNHIIYPSMSANSYSELIERQLGDIGAKVAELHGVSILFDDSVNKFVYRNGVIPAQGTRPVFSTIGGCIENAIPNFLLKAIETGATSIDVRHENHKLIGKIMGGPTTETHSLPCEGSIDKIKNDSDDPNHKAIVSVHEAGHAVIYALLTGLSPTQICAKTASESSGGFVGLHSQTGTRQNYKDKIAIYLGGRAAEQIVFKGENVTTGAESDIDSATEHAVDFVRVHGFGKYKNSMIPITNGNSMNQDIGVEDATQEIRELVNSGQKKAEELLGRNIGLFRKTSELLFNEGKISPSRFVTLCKEYSVEIRELDPKKTVHPQVIDSFRSFVGRR